MRILIVDPDAVVRQSIELMLKSESFNVYSTDLGEEALDLGKLYDYDAIVMEIALPDVSGHTVIKRLREAKIRTPILIASGLAGIEGIVLALNVGADDYMTKPFHKDELVARIHSLVRRSKGHAQSVITTGALSVNINTKTVAVNGKQIHLTAKEYAILELLSLRKGLTISKEMLLNHLYGGMDEPEIKIIDVFICKIRKKLMDATEGATSFVETVWGRGHVLRDDAKPSVPSPSLAPEIHDMIEDDPMRIHSGSTTRKYATADKLGQMIARRKGYHKAPSIVPAQGSGK